MNRSKATASALRSMPHDSAPARLWVITRNPLPGSRSDRTLWAKVDALSRVGFVFAGF